MGPIIHTIIDAYSDYISRIHNRVHEIKEEVRLCDMLRIYFTYPYRAVTCFKLISSELFLTFLSCPAWDYNIAVLM